MDGRAQKPQGQPQSPAGAEQRNIAAEESEALGTSAIGRLHELDSHGLSNVATRLKGLRSRRYLHHVASAIRAERASRPGVLPSPGLTREAS